MPQYRDLLLCNGLLDLGSRQGLEADKQLEGITQASLGDGIGIAGLLESSSLVGKVVNVGVGELSVPLGRGERVHLGDLEKALWCRATGGSAVEVGRWLVGSADLAGDGCSAEFLKNEVERCGL